MKKSILMGISIFNSSVLILLSILVIGCGKQGCLDVDSSNFDSEATDSDGVCTYRYLSRIQVNKLRRIKSGADGWDDIDANVSNGTEETNPDLKFYLKLDASTVWEEVTPLKPDCCSNLPVSWKVNPSDYLRTNFKYNYKFVDVDASGEDLIIEGSFVPYFDYNETTKSIILRNSTNTVEVQLIYEIY